MKYKYVTFPLTRDECRLIKNLRLHGYTWRSIAREMHKQLKGDWGSDQIFGQEFHYKAAETLGENPDDWDIDAPTDN